MALPRSLAAARNRLTPNRPGFLSEPQGRFLRIHNTFWTTYRRQDQQRYAWLSVCVSEEADNMKRYLTICAVFLVGGVVLGYFNGK